MLNNTWKQATAWLLICCAVTISACNQSGLSKGKVDDISLLGTTIEIYQDPSDKAKNELFVHLLDQDGNRISNDSLVLFVNDLPAKVTHKQSLYYTEESYYTLKDVPVKDSYVAEIQLSDGKKYHLGTVKALQEEDATNIVCAEKGDVNKPTVVTWSKLKEIDELSIFKSVRLKSSTAQAANYAYTDEIVKQIGSSGSYVFSKKDYADSTSTIGHLELSFRTTKLGKTNPKLIKGSMIAVHLKIEKTINFEE
jgi:hypothetical protein